MTQTPSHRSPPPPGKLLALDVGLARIGVATCDPLGLSVRPLTVIERRSRRQDFDHIADLIRREAVDAIICGLPLNMDGSKGEQALSTRKWAGRLVRALQKILPSAPPVIFWDERLSTYAAEQILADEETPLYDRTGEDAIAAAVILQSYLDARRRGTDESYGRIDPS